MTFADLHAHTSASDGLATPTEVVDLATRRGLSVLAITDHDTLGGVEEATQAGRARGLRIIPGVEISCDLASRDLHLLALFVDPTHPALLTLLAEARAERDRAGERTVRRLSDLGVPVSMDEVRAEAAGQTLGRPHFARALLRRGQVRSFDEAFERFLGEGRPAHVYRARPAIPRAAEAVRAAGGLLLLAHPGSYPFEAGRDLISRLRLQGLRGVEVHHPAHKAALVRRYQAIAEGLGLCISGGSDYHGTGSDRLGSHGLDEAALARLESRLPG